MDIWKRLTSLPSPELSMIRYNTAGDYVKTSVCYQGVLHKHPHEKDSVILIGYPFHKSQVWYEFKLNNIAKIEDLPNIITEIGDTIRLANVWVKKGSIGLKFQAFEVGNSPPNSVL